MYENTLSLDSFGCVKVLKRNDPYHDAMHILVTSQVFSPMSSLP